MRLFSFCCLINCEIFLQRFSLGVDEKISKQQQKNKFQFFKVKEKLKTFNVVINFHILNLINL